MTLSTRKRNLLATTALAFAGGIITSAGLPTPVVVTDVVLSPTRALAGDQRAIELLTQQHRDTRAAWLRLRRTSRLWRMAYPRPGHSVRQGQRMARKAGNQARNRRAHRGRA